MTGKVAGHDTEDRYLSKEHPECVLPKCDDAFYEYWKPLENMPEEFTN